MREIDLPLVDSPRAAAAPLARPGLTPWVLLRALRPKQWTKNLLLFVGLIFSVNLHHPRLVATALLAFAVFCLLSSAGYLVNDVVDAEADRQHPMKRSRPVASGALSSAGALGLAALLALLGLAGAAALGLPFLGVVALYLLVTASYSAGLKHLVLIDVFVIAAGFVIRAAAGAVAIGVPISPWLYICTGLAALFIALAKRRAELTLLSDNAANHRRNLEHYTIELVDQLIVIVLAATLMAYTLYTFTAENLPANHLMMLTVPVVLYGLFRYLYLVRVRGDGGSPEDIVLKDLPLVMTGLVWIGLSALVLYLG